MTSNVAPAISALGNKAEAFFRHYRAIGLEAVEKAAAQNDDVLDVVITQAPTHVARSWRSKFGQREARHAIYKLAVLITAAGLLFLNLWGMWLAFSAFGFETILGGAATIGCVALLGLFSAALLFAIIAGVTGVPCEVCLAVSLWTRGWTPVSMEWFGNDAGATWGLGSKSIYIWQKPWHGWGNPELRTVRYQDIRITLAPEECRDFLYFCLDFGLPQPHTEWLRLPEASNGMSAEQLAAEIITIASQAGRAVEFFPRRQEDERPSKDRSEHTLIQVIPPSSCWKLLF